MVRKGGLEPPRYCYRQPLKLVRLPIPPLPRAVEQLSIWEPFRRSKSRTCPRERNGRALWRAISLVVRGTPLAKFTAMKRRRLDAKRDRVAHVDQEKSLVDVFEHVIRGVRLSRLRQLLRERGNQRTLRAISLEWAPES